MPENEIISTHRIHGPKVYRLPSGEYVKVFYPKTGLTKRLWFPKYKTFVDNAKRLTVLGFRTITVTRTFHLGEMNADAVQYHPVEGTEFREVLKSDPEKYIVPLVLFLVSLHDQGVFFRGMHLGNVVFDDQGRFGIIDMADLSFHRAPLRIDLRIRQWRRLLRYYQDKPIFDSLGVNKIIQLYLTYAHLNWFERIVFILTLNPSFYMFE